MGLGVKVGVGVLVIGTCVGVGVSVGELDEVLVDGGVVGIGVGVDVDVGVGVRVGLGVSIDVGVGVCVRVGVGVDFFPKTAFVFFDPSWVFLSPLTFPKNRQTGTRNARAKKKKVRNLFISSPLLEGAYVSKAFDPTLPRSAG